MSEGAFGFSGEETRMVNRIEMADRVEERGVWLDMADEVQLCGYSQAAANAEAQKQATAAIERELLTGDARDASHKAAQYSRVLPAFPDQCMIEAFGRDLFEIPSLNPTGRYPKERALLDICRNAMAENRRVGVFVISTRYGLAGRLGMLLHCDGIETYTLDVHAYIEGRTEKMAREIDDGTLVVISHPSDIYAGLAERTFDEIVYYDIDWTVKSGKYRVGKRLRKVTYLAYRNCMQQQMVEYLKDNMSFSEGVFAD